MSFLEWLIAILVWLTADPVELDRQAPRAAAAVAVAMASMTPDDAGPSPAPKPPQDCVCGRTCVNGYWKPDGRILQACNCTCDRCRAKPGKPCPDGKCPVR
jgi:hypothetical protein